MAHLPPLPRESVPEFKARFDHYAATRGFVPNSIRTMARRPEVVRAFMALNQAVLYEGSVPTALKMLVALATSLAAGCRYCQSHMANLSSIWQVPDEKIAAIWELDRSEAFSAAEKAAIGLALKAGMVPNAASAEDFDALRPHFDEAQVVEIVATIALFGYLNRWNDTMATALEPLPAQVAERAVGGAGWEPGKHG